MVDLNRKIGDVSAAQATQYAQEQADQASKERLGLAPAAPEERSALGLGVEIGFDRVGQATDALQALNPFASPESQRGHELDVKEAGREMDRKIQESGVNTSFLDSESVGEFVEATLFNGASQLPDLAITLGSMVVGTPVGALATRAGLRAAGREAVEGLANREFKRLVKSGIGQEAAKDMAERVARDKFRAAITTSVNAVPMAGQMIGEASTSQIEQLGHVDSPLGAIATGIPAAFAEYLPISRRINEVARPEMSAGLYKRMGAVVQDAELANPGILKRIGQGSLKGAAEEATAEVLQTAIIDSYVDYLDENAEFFTPETLRELAEAAVGGAMLGGLFGGAGGARKRKAYDPRTNTDLGTVENIEKAQKNVEALRDAGDVDGAASLLATTETDIERLTDDYVALSAGDSPGSQAALADIETKLRSLGDLRNELTNADVDIKARRKEIDAQEKADAEAKVAQRTQEIAKWNPKSTVVDADGVITDRQLTSSVGDMRDFSGVRDADGRVFNTPKEANDAAKELGLPDAAFELNTQDDGGIVLQLTNAARTRLDKVEAIEWRRSENLITPFESIPEAREAAKASGLQSYHIIRDGEGGYRLTTPPAAEEYVVPRPPSVPKTTPAPEPLPAPVVAPAPAPVVAGAPTPVRPVLPPTATPVERVRAELQHAQNTATHLAVNGAPAEAVAAAEAEVQSLVEQANEVERLAAKRAQEKRDAEVRAAIHKARKAAATVERQEAAKIVHDAIPEVPVEVLEGEIEKHENSAGEVPEGTTALEMAAFAGHSIRMDVRNMPDFELYAMIARGEEAAHSNAHTLDRRIQAVLQGVFAKAEQLRRENGLPGDLRPFEVWHERAQLAIDRAKEAVDAVTKAGGVVHTRTPLEDLAGKGSFDIVGADASTPAKMSALLARYRDARFESAKVVMLDKDGKVLGVSFTTVGHPGSVSVAPPDSLRDALAKYPNVAKVYTSHNHPSGSPYPSAGDTTGTESLGKSLGDLWAGEIITDTNHHTFYNPVTGDFAKLTHKDAELRNVVPKLTHLNDKDFVVVSGVKHGVVTGVVEVPRAALEAGEISAPDLALALGSPHRLAVKGADLKVDKWFGASTSTTKIEASHDLVDKHVLALSDLFTGNTRIAYDIGAIDSTPEFKPAVSWDHVMDTLDIKGKTRKGFTRKGDDVYLGPAKIGTVPKGNRDAMWKIENAIYMRTYRHFEGAEMDEFPKTWQGAAMALRVADLDVADYGISGSVEGNWTMWQKDGLDPLTAISRELRDGAGHQSIMADDRPVDAIESAANAAGVDPSAIEIPASLQAQNAARKAQLQRDMYEANGVDLNDDLPDPPARPVDIAKAANQRLLKAIKTSELGRSQFAKARSAKERIKVWMNSDAKLAKATLALTSPYQLERAYRKQLPRMTRVQHLLSEFTAIAESPHIRDTAASIFKKYRGLSAEDQKALSSVAHRATLAQYNPFDGTSDLKLIENPEGFQSTLDQLDQYVTQSQAKIDELHNRAAAIESMDGANTTAETKRQDQAQAAGLREQAEALQEKLNAAREKLSGMRAQQDRNVVNERLYEEHEQIQKDFDALPQEGKEALQEMRDQYAERRGEEIRQMDLLIERLRNEGSTEMQVAHFIDLRDQLAKETVYFPLRRQGDYWVNARVNGEVVYNAAFDNFMDRQDAIDNVRKQYGEDVEIASGTAAIEEDGQDLRIPELSYVESVRKAISQANEQRSENRDTDKPTISPEAAAMLSDAIYQQYLKYLPQLSPKKSQLHREGIAGFDDDAGLIFIGEMDRASRMAGRAEYGAEIRAQTEATREDAKAISNESQIRRTRAEAQMWAETTPEELMNLGSLEELDATVNGTTTSEGLAVTVSKFYQRVQNAPDAESREAEMANAIQRLPSQIRARQETLALRIEAIDDFAQYAEREGDLKAAKRQDFLHHLAQNQQNAMDFALNPTTSKWAVHVNKYGFNWFLGANVSTAVLNLAQTATVTASVVGARHGLTTAYGELSKATSEVWKSSEAALRDMTDAEIDRLLPPPDNDGDVPVAGERRRHDYIGMKIRDTLVDDFEKRAYLEFNRTQTIQRSLSDDAMADRQTPGLGIETSRNRAVQLADTVMRKVPWFFSQTERINREATAIAAYRLERKKQLAAGLDAEAAHLAATDYAIQITKETHLDYGNTNRPEVMRGDVTRVMFQFQTYPLGMLRMYADSIRRRLAAAKDNGELTPEEAAAAKKELRYLLTTQFAVGGAAGLPFLGFGYSAAAMLHNLLSEEEEKEDTDVLVANVTKVLANMISAEGSTMNKFIQEAVHKGFINATLGIDAGSRLSLSYFMYRPEIGEQSHEEWYATQLVSLAGPVVGGIGLNVSRALDKMDRSPWQAGESLAPTAVGNLMKGIRFASDGGAVNKYGEMQAEMDYGDITLQAIGFAASHYRLQMLENSAIYTKSDRLKKVRGGYLQMLHAIRRDGSDAGDIQEWLAEVQAFNERNPHFKLTADNIKASIKTREKRAATQRNGLHLSGSEERRAWLFSQYNFN